MIESSEDVPELLFFDTFSHDIHEKLNLDLVQFPKPVYITEVRIIPLGARVKANFSGGVRLGATNPSQFQIEFFVNDLGKGASTFENLGSFEYNQNDYIHLECKGTDPTYRQIPTDGLVLRGWYTTITLAVYGTLTKTITEPIISPQVACEPPAPIITATVPVRIATPEVVDSAEVDPKWSQEIPAQHEYYGDEVPKDPRPYAKVEKEWNQNSNDAVVVVPEEKDKKAKVKIRTPEQLDASVRAHERSREFSRSPSREYAKREWSHSPEYRQRRNRGASFDRSRRDSSYDRLRDAEKSSPNFDEHRVRRPRSPTGSPRHPRSPVVQRASPIGSEEDTQFGRISASNGTSVRSKSVEKSQAIRVIDYSSEERNPKSLIQSPASTTNTPLESPALIEEDDAMSVGEQFEPILSDDDIADEMDPFGDLDYDLAEHEDPIKIFNPFTVVLERFLPNDDTNPSTEDQQILKYLQQITKTLCSLNSQFTDVNLENFKDLTSDCKEIWVHFTEQIVQSLTHLYAYDNEKNNEYLGKIISELKEFNASAILTNCLKIGLDYDTAFNHLQAGYKIRHIKCGVRLAEYLCCYKDFMKLMINEPDINIFEVIFELYSQNFMALSIKLMILKAIYSMLDTKDAIDYFLGESNEIDEESLEEASFNGYKYLIGLLQHNTSTRLAIAIKSLIKKINLYESLQLIRENVVIILESTEKMDIENGLIYDCLREIHRAMTVDEIQYSQPKRYLPVKTKFENTEDGAAKICIYNGLLSYFRIHYLLETIVLLLGIKHILIPKLVGIVQDVLTTFLQKPIFLDYLIKNIETTNHLTKFLLHDVESNYDLLTNSQELGLEIVFKIQTKYYLTAIENSKNDIDKLVEYLQSLFCLTFSFGRPYVVQVICMDNNLVPLLNLIESEKKVSKEGSPGVKCKSPVLSYAVDLVDCAIRHCENIEFLKLHGPSLVTLVKQHDVFEPSVSAMLQEMAVYLKPLEIQDVFSYNEITPLVEMMKRSIEFITTFPGDLIMSLRIIRYLGISVYDDIEGTTDNIELKYKYMILKFYSADGVSLLISILDKLNTYFEQPDIHSATLINNQGVLLTQILLPAVKVLRKMITYVIQCRNTDFKDLTALEHLLKTYSLMHSISTKALCYKDAKKIQVEIIHTILTYTQPSPAAGMDTENIHKSLWTQMIGEILKFILNGPYCFIPGLLAFSELLPLPLPVPSKEPLSELEVNKILNQRQLWSAHLHPQSQLISEMIQTICTSSYSQVLMILSRVCLQLSDLAPNMTLLVSKSIIDLILNDPLEEEVTTSQYARLFNFLSGLVGHPSVKVSLLSIMGGKMLELITNLLTTMNSSDVHILMQENIHIVLQNLLDSEICMMSNTGPNSNMDLVLASALPSKEILSTMINLIVGCVCHLDCPSSIFLTAARTMLLLTENNATLSYLMLVLEKKKNEFNSVIEKFVGNYKSEKETLLPVFVTLFEFFKTLTSLDSSLLVNSMMGSQRTVILDSNQLANVLNWPRKSPELDKVKIEKIDNENNDNEISGDVGKKGPAEKDNKEEKPHYLIKLLEMLDSEKKDDQQTTENPRVNDLEECINVILAHLNGNIQIDKTMDNYCNFTENLIDQLPQAEGIVTQYASRTIYVLSTGNFDEQLNANYWLNSPVYDEEVTMDQITCDLTEIIRTCLPADTNITADCKRLLHLSASPQSSRDRIATASCFRTRRVEVEPSTGRPEKKIYATPPRGRGFTRSPLTRGDLFRSRPPNTSRPPSLHVDDFLALETCGVQLVCPTGYNKIPREIIPRGRGAGRGRGFMSERGRISISSGAVASGTHWQSNSSQWQSSHDQSNSVGTHQSSHFTSAHHYRDQQHFGAPSSRARVSRGLRHMGARVYPR